jgi:hypothetical protein
MKQVILIVSVIFLFSELSYAQELYNLPEGISTRWSSAENWKGEKGKGGILDGGRKGSPAFTINSGESKVLAEVHGSSGIVRRIWMTVRGRTPKTLRGLKIEMYWDDAKTPAVSAPIGDFFGQGLGKMVAFENAFFSSPLGTSFNCFIPMLFQKSMKILINNTTDEKIVVFYDIDYTLGDKPGNRPLYFHAVFNHLGKTKLREDYEVLPKISGKGRFLGANLSVIANQKDYLNIWWGEGEVKMYIDGDKAYPTLCGTGTEDYVGAGWGLGEFSHLYQGCTIGDEKDLKYAFYRFHIPDPVYFYSDLKVTIQQIGYTGNETAISELAKLKSSIINAGEKGDTVDFSSDLKNIGFERSDDYASCAYFYLSEPENDLNHVTRPGIDSSISK